MGMRRYRCLDCGKCSDHPKGVRPSNCPLCDGGLLVRVFNETREDVLAHETAPELRA